MTESVEARMIASLEANIRDYQKKMDKALGVSKKTFGGINDNAKNVEKQITKAMGNTAQVISTLHGPLGGVASRFSSFGSTVSRTGLIVGTATTAIGALTFSAHKAIAAFTLFETQQLTTQQIIRATGGAAGKTSIQIEKLAQDIALVTLASRQAARQAANQLLTFKSVTGDTFDRTLRAAQDLAAAGFGSISSNAVQLGKALERPVEGIAQLREVGLSFTIEQRKMIQNFVDMGKAAEAQKVILKAVEEQVGGAGARQGQGLAGAWDSLSETTGIVLEQWGETIAKAIRLKSVIEGLTDAVGSLRKEAPLESHLESTEREALRLARSRDIEARKAGATVGTNVEMFHRDKGFREGLIREVEQRRADEQKKAVDEFLTSEEKLASRTRERIALEREAEAVLKRAREDGVPLTQEQAEEQAKLNLRLAEESGAIKTATDAYTKRKQSVADTTRQYEIEAEVIRGLTDTTLSYNDALEATKIITELLLAAEKEGLTVTAEMRAKIEELAKAQVEANKAATAAAEEYKRVAGSVGEIRDEGKDALKTLADDLRRGEDAAEALKNALTKVGDKLIDIGLESLGAGLEGIFGKGGKSSGGGGGFFGAISKFLGFRADGGRVEKGKPYIVGERRPELFVPDSAGRIVPRVPQQSGSGGGAVVNITTPPGDTVEQRRSRRGNQDIIDVVVKRTGQTYGLKRPATRT